MHIRDRLRIAFSRKEVSRICWRCALSTRQQLRHLQTVTATTGSGEYGSASVLDSPLVNPLSTTPKLSRDPVFLGYGGSEINRLHSVKQNVAAGNNDGPEPLPRASAVSVRLVPTEKGKSKRSRAKEKHLNSLKKHVKVRTDRDSRQCSQDATIESRSGNTANDGNAIQVGEPTPKKVSSQELVRKICGISSVPSIQLSREISVLSQEIWRLGREISILSRSISIINRTISRLYHPMYVVPDFFQVNGFRSRLERRLCVVHTVPMRFIARPSRRRSRSNRRLSRLNRPAYVGPDHRRIYSFHGGHKRRRRFVYADPERLVDLLKEPDRMKKETESLIKAWLEGSQKRRTKKNLKHNLITKPTSSCQPSTKTDRAAVTKKSRPEDLPVHTTKRAEKTEFYLYPVTEHTKQNSPPESSLLERSVKSSPSSMPLSSEVKSYRGVSNPIIMTNHRPSSTLFDTLSGDRAGLPRTVIGTLCTSAVSFRRVF